jgi:hypothetical protein
MKKAFSPGSEAAAAQPFTYAGVAYAKGDRFPYRDLGIIDFDLRGLWSADRIGFLDKPYAAASTQPTAPAAKNQQQRR